MRLARWTAPGDDDRTREGFIIGDRAVEFPDGLTVADVIAGGLDAARTLHSRIEPGIGTPWREVGLLPPLVPASIRDFVAFEEHVEGVSAAIDGTSHVPAEWYEAPTFYFTNPHTVLGPDAPLRPPVAERLDFELEVAAVIGGGGGANLSVTEAEHVIFGYTIMNDWSARDLQGREMKVRLGPAKGKDFATSLGPWIVTADELSRFVDGGGYLALRAEVFVNDRLVGADLVSNMAWPFAALVAYASRNSRVVDGDVLGSGTVGNGGCLAELWGRSGSLSPAPLRAGDEVRMNVEGIGSLRNPVGAPVVGPEIPAATARPRLRVRA
ncbi:fumarylacetoacetate hydrolase family protein [Microbacterium sp.]|uniref:fumarylacetoacetate hydrolase family protein n=1 Tax=Microbacterium sp. TaxID=51671 RepID=UPI003C7163F9